MNPERWPGEPLHERLTIAERQEVQAWYVRAWLAQKRRDRYAVAHGNDPRVKRYDARGRRVA